MKFSNRDFLSKCDQIHSFLRIWSHLTEEILNGKLRSFFVQCRSKCFSFRISGYHNLTTKFPVTGIILINFQISRNRPYID